jgi:hypothetical protein
VSKPSKGRGVDVKGKSKKDAHHVRHYSFELQSLAYRSLCVGARALLTEIKDLFNGSNNGELFLSVRDAADKLNVGKSAASDWFADLVDRGFIRPKVEAGFSWKTAARARKATCWILTEYATGGAAPTRDFQHWRPTELSERVPEKIRRSANGYSLYPIPDSLYPIPDSTPPTVPNSGQIRPIQPSEAPELSAIGYTVNHQVGEAQLGSEPEAAEGLRSVGTILRSLDIPAVVRAGGRQPTPSLVRAATRKTKPSQGCKPH